MHIQSELIHKRVDRLIGERIVPAITRRSHPLSLTAWEVDGEPVSFTEAVTREYTPVEAGLRWGAPWSTTWFSARGEVPADWLEEGDVPEGASLELLVDLGFTSSQPGFQAEGLVYDATGRILKATQPRNRWVPLAPGPVDLYIEAAGNPDVIGWNSFYEPTDLGDRLTAGDSPLYELRTVEVVLRDRVVWELWQDMVALSGLARELPTDSERRAQIEFALDRLCDVIDPEDVAGSAAAGREVLEPMLRLPASASAHQVHAVGHAHIDSAWLWPLRETVRKCARTFSNQIALMEDNPDFVFACSSAQQYSWIEEHYPDLFERLKEKVAEGRFAPVGSMWVESDTNLPGGESLVRQFLEGKNYFQSRFGIDTKEAWLPDSFGYTGAMPQIVRQAGCDHFLSQKMSWNETNVMPHHTFTWHGIDGTGIFTHFPPVDTYNSDLSAAELRHAASNFRDKSAASVSLVPFGYGDGGGGPTREMLAAAERFADLEGAPRVELSSSQRFFEVAKQDHLAPATWSGEMYLEFHRGTYTAQALMKQGNRRSEHLLREAELWASTAALRTSYEYPAEDLQRIWREVLLYQFHDILPGSSIGWVHREAAERYQVIAAELESIINDSLRSLVGEGEREIVANATPHTHHGVVPLGAAELSHVAGEVLVDIGKDATVIDTGRIRVRMEADGTFSSLIDLLAGRETVPQGRRANLLQLHRDTPRQWDAWDVDVEYKRVGEDLLQVAELDVQNHGGGATVRIRRDFGSSHITQTLRFEAGSASIDILNDIDWHEKQKLLKLAFPVDVHTQRATSEIQFGHVQRATHTNTSWDAARFETCAHRWVHVGDAGFGYAVANSATYGHDITQVLDDDKGGHSLIRLSLLRSALYPDPRADEGQHQLRVRVVPGATIPEAIVTGYALNVPLRTVVGGADIEPLLTVEAPGVIVESVKLAADGSGDLIVRLYEAHGGRGRGTVHFSEGGQIRTTDLLERDLTVSQVKTGDGEAALDLRPFQIVTLRVQR